MKRILALIVLCFTLSSAVQAQIQWYQTSEVAIKYKRNGYWGNWSDWEKCVCNVKFDLNNDVITIYSKKTQVYKVLYTMEPLPDDSGTQVRFKVRDQDSDLGELRLRIEYNGNSQIYIDFADVSWVYNVKRIS